MEGEYERGRGVEKGHMGSERKMEERGREGYLGSEARWRTLSQEVSLFASSVMSFSDCRGGGELEERDVCVCVMVGACVWQCAGRSSY